MGDFKGSWKSSLVGFAIGVGVGWVLFGICKVQLIEIHIGPMTLGIPPTTNPTQPLVVSPWFALVVILVIVIISMLLGGVALGGKRLFQKRRGSQELVIHIAIFGRGNNEMREVTEAVREIVATGTRRFRVTTSLLPSLQDDPCPGKEKDLKVVYSRRGETYAVAIHEYDWLQLPE